MFCGLYISIILRYCVKNVGLFMTVRYGSFLQRLCMLASVTCIYTMSDHMNLL